MTTGSTATLAAASFAQQRLWFLDRLESGSAVYHIPLAVRLRGGLDRRATRAALERVVVRHETLRTTFAVEDGEVVQVIHSGMGLSWREAELDQAGDLPGALAAESRRRFDLGCGPLLRVVLWRLGPEDHVLQLTLHHIISDGWSLGIMIREFEAAYLAERGGTAPPLPDLAIQYADFAAWQRDALQGERPARDLAYWRAQLAGAPALLPLPADRPRPSVQGTAGRTHRFTLGSELTNALNALSRLTGGSLYMTLLGGFAVLLQRLTGSSDLVIGTPVANRTRSEIEPLIGFFVNTLALRLDLTGDPTVRGVLERVRTVTLGALEHQGMPFEKLVQELRPERTLGHAPIFQVMFGLQNAPLGALRLPGLAAEPVEVETATAKFDLGLALEEEDGGIVGRLEYNLDLFEAATIERLAEFYRRILRGLADAPGARVGDLDLMAAAEREQVTTSWNQTRRDYPDRTMGELFAEQAAARPRAAAVRFAGEEIDYGELDARSNRLAHFLRGLGVGPDTLVAVCLERSFDLIVALLGIIKAGGAYVALDPEYPAARLVQMQAEAGNPLLLTQEKLLGRLPAGGERVVLDRDAGVIGRESPAAPAVSATLESLAYVSFTSGSTGRPKGVAIPQRGVVRLVKNTDFADLGPGETLLQLAPVAFDASTLEIWGPLLNGGKLVVAAPGTPTLEELGRLLREETITTLWLTSGLFHLMADERLDDLRGLRQLLAGGDVLGAPQVRRVLREIPSLRLVNGYGPTENTTFTCCRTLREQDLAAGSVPVGRPIANTRVYILDERLRPVAVGVPGELYAGGDGLARGYLRDPGLSAMKFIPDPFAEGGTGRLYRTGDRARWRADGSVEFLGRLDQQVKIRGYRIEPGEVEAAMAAEPGVQSAFVLVREDAGRKRIVGYVTGTATAADLRARLQARLPDYLVPAAIVVLDSLPLAPNGKVDRAALPAPDPAGGSAFVPPRTPVEEMLANLWARLLGLERVGTGDDFFACGGHSLLATQLVTRIREAFAADLPLRAVFESPTVARLAARIEQARRNPAETPAPLTRAPRTAALPLSFAQERLWFLNQLEPGNPFYNMPAALRLKGAFDPAAAAAVLRALVRRHESLRTIFVSVDGQPVQRILDEIGVPLPLTDLAPLADVERAAALARHMKEEARRPFDLQSGPLLRARLIRLEPAEHVLLLTMHHIVSDGWSMGVLTREMGELYAAFSDGRPSPLQDLTWQYADFAVWQRAWLTGRVLAGQLDYWRLKLADAPPVLLLPTDRPRPPVQSFRGGSHPFLLERPLAERLAAFSREAGATLFMTLQASFAALLGRLANVDDVVLGTPIANRHRAEVEPLIGFFVNTLVLRTDLAGAPSFRELVARARQTALEAYAHQDLPFERLVDELQPERDLSRNPIFQVMFALHNTPQREQVLPGLVITDLAAERISAQFDLVLDLWETTDGLKAVLEFATDLFDAATVRRVAGHWRTLLVAALEAPDEPLASLPLLSAAEQGELLDGFNATAMPYPEDRTLQALIGEQARRTPERIAATHRGRHLTYAELDRDSNRLARLLLSLGVKPNDFVGILEERGVDCLVAMVGVLKAGAAFLPIDPAYPAERVRYMVENSEVATLIARGSCWAGLEAGSRARALSDGPAGEKLRDLVLLGESVVAASGVRVHRPRDWGGESAAPLEDLGAGTDYAYMLYTSGSTGLPKGAIIRHNGAVNHIYGQFRELAFHPATAFLQSAPSSSDISVWQFLAPLLCGGRTVIADYETVCDPARLHALIKGEGITLVELVPVVLKELLDHAAALPPPACALPALEFAMVTGETVAVALVNQWFHLYPRVRLANAYGPTEAADDICQAVFDGPLPADLPTVPIGRPLPNLTLYVLDARLALVPLGVAGEICVSGVGVGAGYWRNEEKTRAAFVHNPHADERRGAVLYRTGDLGRWRPDGSLEMLGRFDQQVKLRGFRIELGEIEGMLNRHPAVAEAVALVREDRPGDKRLVAYLTPDAGGEGLRERIGALQGEQVALWEDLHEDSYRDTLDYGDAAFNVIGWDSNYTGAPLPAAEMREYVGHTAERVRELSPRRVLELGCGTGLLLFPLAPGCDYYLGTDLSRVAVDRLAAAVAARPDMAHVELRAQRADDFTGIPAASFDVVMLCSVVQYFPGVDYFLTVIEGAFRALRPGGAIFLGDVRMWPLLPAFHLSVQLAKAEDGLTAAELRRNVRGAVAREQEMALDPSIFGALRARFPRITRVEVRPKRGSLHNEMTCFRADVTLHTGAVAPAPNLAWIEWSDRALGLAQLRRRLADSDSPLALRGVANPRVHRELRTLAWLESARAGETVGTWRAALDEEDPAGLEPEDLLALGKQLGWDVQLAFSPGAADGRFDAVFQRPSGEGAAPVAFFAPPPSQAPWSTYANNPLREKLARDMVAPVRAFLRERLPAHMVPAEFVVLEAMPLQPNGKIDRAALPVPAAEAGADDEFVAPSTPTEEKLAAIWATVLGRERISVRANFFALGGHSLKATQVVSRIGRELGVEVALREMFARPTVAEMAGEIEGRRRTGHEQIPAAPTGEDYPLSHAQLRLWVLAQMDGVSAAYNMPASLRLDGPVDAGLLERALAIVAQRHDSLRTSFVFRNGEPRQVVHPAPLGRLERLDLSGEADPESAAQALARADAVQPFDFERGPLLRAALLRLAPDRHVLLFCIHHIVSDDWSQGVMVREFIRTYAELGRGGAPDLPALRVQYRDYAVWQRTRLESDALAPHRDYWRSLFAGQIPVLDLVPDHPRPAVKTYRGRSRPFLVPPDRARELQALARREKASLFMVLLAAVQGLLHRLTGQDDLVVGFPIAGRDHPDLEDQIGFYVNTLPLRTKVDGSRAFTALLDQVRQAATEAYEHQSYPLDRLVEDLALPRDVARSPLFDVVVVMQNVDPYALELEGATVRPFLDESAVSKFDLAFHFEERAGGLQGTIVFNPDLFADERIARLAAGLDTLLASIAADPGQTVAKLGLLPPEERRRVLAAADPARAEFKFVGTLVERFEAQAVRTPERTALTLPGDPAGSLAYAELNDRANRVAHYLRARGVGPEVRVGLYVERSLEMVVGLLGILKAGGAYLPLDPAYPRERLAFMLKDGGVSVLLTQGDLARDLPFAGQVIRLDADGPAVARESAANLPPVAGPDHAAYVIYTSGSTGRPKGCVVTHRQATRLFAATQAWFEFGADDVWTLFHSHAFDFSVWEIWGALLWGGRLVIVRFGVSRAPDAFLRLVSAEKVTVLNQTPSAFRSLMQADAELGLPLVLRFVVFGGEALDVPSLRPWFDRHGDEAPRLVNMYGITETTVHVTYRALTRGDCAAAVSVVGVPLPDLQLHIIERGGQPAPIGVAGEIWVGGAGVARGYLGRPELTAERFVPDPFSGRPGAVLYRSGDLARRLASGDVEYLGRIDQQVKIRGFRIELGEIEAALAEHPAVGAALVVVRAGAAGDERLVAYVVGPKAVRSDAQAIDLAALRETLKARLPSYMVPAAIVAMESFPLTPNGKIDRRALPAPDAAPEAAPAFAAPRNALEETIARLWGEALGIERVDRHANFFDLGGHSLLVVQVHRQLREALGRELSVVDLFKHSTVAGLAAFLGADAPTDDGALDDARARGRRQREARGRRRGGRP